MPSKLIENRFAKTFLILTATLTIGGFHIRPVLAQADKSAIVETARKLNLSLPQMRAMRSIMQDFSADVQQVLTPEQYEQLQLVREQQQSQPENGDPQNAKEVLNLTDVQVAQLSEAKQETVTELQEILTPEQVEEIMGATALGQL